MKRRGLSLAMVVITLALGACSLGGGGEGVGVQRGALRRAGSCSDLESMLEADARAKMNARIDAQIAATRRLGEGPIPYGDAKGGAVPSAGGAAGDPSSRARDFSETNLQVEGVDEADIVKTDGKYIYLLHGSTFRVLDAWPAASLADTASFDLEGTPIEMFVTGSMAVVYSIVDGTPIYAAAGVAPRAEYFDGYGYSGVAIAPRPDAQGGPGSFFFLHPLTKLTVLRLAGAQQPSLARELYFEGSYVSSRRVGSRVRTVLQGGGHGPSLSYWPATTPAGADAWVAAFEQLRRANDAAIAASTAADWLPYAMERAGAAVTARAMDCADLYVPSEGSTDYGLTTLTSIDLDAPADPPRTTGIVAQVDTVYASERAMYLAARAWQAPDLLVMASSGSSGASDGGTVVDAGVAEAGVVEAGMADAATPEAGPAPPARSSPSAAGPRSLAAAPADGAVTIDFTYLHKFDLTADPSAPAYVASGTVAGTVVDQFSLDERGDLLRLTTTEDRTATDHWETSRVNHLYVLGVEGDALVVRGDAGEIAPGERVYSTRFVGDYGYVVTFRQVDPLFVVDLHDPAAPAVVGELTIPGFSTYMHPIDDTHLLTIGDESSKLTLQIFDVTRPTAPALAQKLVYGGDQYGYSQAQYDHKAFTYFAAQKLLAFPFTAWNEGGMRSSLEVVRVDVAGGLLRLGSIDHSAFFAQAPRGFCGGFFGPEVRRGLFLESFVYSVSYGGVVASDVADLTNPVRVLPLPAPTAPTGTTAPCAP